nr:MAG TPA: hypothetical protein [Bacteriophage sp.]
MADGQHEKAQHGIQDASGCPCILPQKPGKYKEVF